MNARQISDEALQCAIDGKTKPVGALGRLEEVALQIARLQGSLAPVMDRCTLTLFAADHGLAAEGVSAYPQSVTRQMVLNFLRGGAAANAFARVHGIDVRVVDAGVAPPAIAHPGLTDRRLGAGTQNAAITAAMTAEQAQCAWEAGFRLGAESPGEAAAFGEMGIGNTSSAALFVHKVTGRPLAELVGRGTGVNDKGLARKRAVLSTAAARTPDRLTPVRALEEYGGFEWAMMAGAMAGAADQGKLVLVDGFIAGAAALYAVGVAPGARAAMVFAHRSTEPGHAIVLGELQARPLLDLEMRLGEGTGALVAWPVVRCAAAILTGMASFAEAQVDGPA